MLPRWAKGAANEAVLGQLSAYPKAMYMSSALLLGIGFFRVPLGFAILATMIAGIAYMKKAEEERERQALLAKLTRFTAVVEETPQDILKLDEVRLEWVRVLCP